MDVPIIYVGRRYTATVDGSTYKKVVCEHCGEIFYYELQRRAVGEGESAYFLDNKGAQFRAEERARDRLAKRLAGGCEPVPCPQCAKYQARMVRILRARRHAWMGWIIYGLSTVLLVAATFLCKIYDLQPERDAALIILALSLPILFGVIFWTLQYRWRLRFDPNVLDGTDPTPHAPPALRLLNDPADFDRPEARLRFENAWLSKVAAERRAEE